MMLASLYLTFFSVLLSFPFAKSTDDISHLSIYTDEVNVYTGLFHNFILQKPMTSTMLEIGLNPRWALALARRAEKSAPAKTQSSSKP